MAKEEEAARRNKEAEVRELTLTLALNPLPSNSNPRTMDPSILNPMEGEVGL